MSLSITFTFLWSFLMDFQKYFDACVSLTPIYILLWSNVSPTQQDNGSFKNFLENSGHLFPISRTFCNALKLHETGGPSYVTVPSGAFWNILELYGVFKKSFEPSERFQNILMNSVKFCVLKISMILEYSRIFSLENSGTF